MKEMELKKKVLKQIIEQMMAKDGEGLKKVTVMAKDKEGLEKGLQKAEEIVGDETGACETCGHEDCEGCEEDDDKSDLKKALFDKLMNS